MSHWPAIRAATAHDPASRVPFAIDGTTVGSVAPTHLAALARWRAVLAISPDRVDLQAPPEDRDAVLAEINHALREAGLIVGWRDETYRVPSPDGRASLAHIERAASRFWGTLTFGAHATGYVAAEDGRPTALWIAQRSWHKPTDPGLFDNLIGGGVPAAQTPHEALVREGWEEAGLGPAVLQRARPGRTIQLRRDIREGLQREWLYSWDLALEAGEYPANQDGEVAAFQLLPVAEALALAAGETMTVDAALVTLDFALRHRLLSASDQDAAEAASASLWR